MEQHTIKSACETFTRDLDAIRGAAPFTILTLSLASAHAGNAVRKFVEEKCIPQELGGQKSYEIPRERIEEYRRLTRNMENASAAANLIPRTFIVSLTSQYDAFIARLLSAAFYMKPELLNVSERKLTFNEIAAYSSIGEIKDSIIDAEVENLLRKSLTEQFEAFEAKFDLTLRTNLPSWKELIEITQRRNLFVHSDGAVSKQYLTVCSSNKVDLGTTKIGDKLAVDSAYFRRAHLVLSEIGIKLGQVIWRKLAPKESAEADDYVNVLCFDLLKRGHYNLAKNLLDFTFSKTMKHPNRQTEMMLVVNRANAHKLAGDFETCRALVEPDDWSAYDPKFKLAKAVLLEQNDVATSLMLEIGNASHPNKHEYREWPLFKNLRLTEEFVATFKKLFNEELVPEVELKSPLDEYKESAVKSFGFSINSIMGSTQEWMSNE